MSNLILESSARDKHRNDVRTARRAEHIPHFIGVDGEGVTRDDGVQDYVLLGVGQKQIDNPDGLHFPEIMQFLYTNFEHERTPKFDPVFVGFFLAYDFSHWIKDLPKNRAWSLLTQEGIAKRTRTKSGGNTVPFPIRWAGWEFDMLGMRRFKLRPACCDTPWTCRHANAPWMYINDCGPFWQTSLLSALDPRRWPEPVVTDAEYQSLQEGKSRRAVAQLDDDMRYYNRLENAALARLMQRQARGLTQMGVQLKKDQWHGPGQASAAWFTQQGVPRRKHVNADRRMLEACRRSYIAGWFELTMHGQVPGDSYGYDINSAYPHIMSSLPCLQHGTYRHGRTMDCPSEGLVLIEGLAVGSNPFLGAMLHRIPEATIARPQHTRGSFWLHELRAAKRAGLIDKWVCTRWYQYIPCDCAPPLKNMANLYDYRQRIGKNTAAGKAAKLIYNSGYGKFAQSVGMAPFGNWIYASLITAGCRVMILDAIASHPGGAKSVAMIATDGVFFTEKHPSLPISDKLGDWDETVKHDLFLFKPGFYWDAESKGKITYKSRGIRAIDFAEQIPKIERQFWLITGLVVRSGEPSTPPHWPFAKFQSSFSMLTPLQALRQGRWDSVAEVSTDKMLIQSSDPTLKRVPVLYADRNRSGLFLRSPVWEVPRGGIRSLPYDKMYADEKLPQFEDISPDGGLAAEWTIATEELRGGD